MTNVFKKVLVVLLLIFSFASSISIANAQYADRDSVKFPVNYPPFGGQNVVIEVRAYNRDTGAVSMHNVSTELGRDGSGLVQIGNLQPGTDYSFAARMRLTGESFYGNYSQEFGAQTTPNFDGGGKVRLDLEDYGYPNNYYNDRYNYSSNYDNYPASAYPYSRSAYPGGYSNYNNNSGYYYPGGGSISYDRYAPYMGPRPRDPFADWEDNRYPGQSASGKVCL